MGNTRRAAHAARTRRVRVLVTVTVVVFVLGGFGFGGWYLWSQYGKQISQAMGWVSNDYEGEGHGKVIVSITDGQTGEDIAVSLAKADVVRSSEAFYQLLLAQDEQPQFLPGSYTMKLQMSAEAALRALQDPEHRMQLTATIPEGKTLTQTLEIVSAGSGIALNDLQTAANNVSAFDLPEGVTSLEGWVFPARYDFLPTTTADQAVRMLVDEQKKVLDEFAVPEADRERVLTIAAIVQREAGRVEDFSKVSRVIANRLELGMRLQMDSTVQYGYGQHADGKVWSSDEALADDNPWNTYKHTGLPAGPIANPGRDAIAAALNPEPGDWLYFVAKNLETGESVFTSTREEHEQAVEQLHQWCLAHPGKGC